MGTTITARNSTQQGISQLIEARVTNANTGLFTATKRTKVTSITCFVDSVGADSTYAVSVKRGANNNAVGDMKAAKGTSIFSGEMILEIGDIITNVGDSGSTNASTDMTANILELS
jgi:hypothetical protein